MVKTTTGTTTATRTCRPTRLTYGVTMDAELDAGDIDVFRFDLQGRADIEVRGSGRLDTVAELLDSEGEVIGEDDDSGPSFNFGFRETLDGGVYYVRVSSDVGDTGTHKITAYIVREDDHGDTSGNSSVLPLGVRATARIAPATDRDVFRVEVEHEGQLAGVDGRAHQHHGRTARQHG